MTSAVPVNSSGVGRIVVWQGGSLWLGRAGVPTGEHAHHAVQITLGLDGPVWFRAAREPEWVEYPGAVVAAHRPHAFRATGILIAHLFVEPESASGRRLLNLVGERTLEGLPSDQVAALAAPLLRAYQRGERDEMAAAGGAAIAALAAGQLPVSDVDSRISRSLLEIERRIGHVPRLAEIAACVHLSPGRFRHLFVAQTGLSFRAYVLWLRMQRAVQAMGAGHSLTDVAHAAGFADSAHLNRTFRRMFGISPGSLKQG